VDDFVDVFSLEVQRQASALLDLMSWAQGAGGRSNRPAPTIDSIGLIAIRKHTHNRAVDIL